MKKIFTITILASISFCFSLHSQSREIHFSEYDLKNGLHVILHQDTSLPIVAIYVMYHVGSKNEDPERNGFAHFFEHLMFDGSANVKNDEYSRYIQNAGGNDNAYTSFDITTYFEVLPSNQLELALWLESDRMMALKIDSTAVETQRKVVKEERKMRYENQPYGSITQEVFSRAFTKIPYQWVPIGYEQYIDKATLREFIDFHDVYYVPENAVISIAGNIDVEETKALVEKYFGSIPQGKKEIIRPNVTEPPKTKEVRDTVYDNIQLGAVIKAYHIPKKGDPDFYPIDLLQNALSVGQSSRLYKSLVDKQQLALEIGSYPYDLEDAGLFFIVALANSGVDCKTLEKAIDAEIDSVKVYGMSEIEFEKIQNQVENYFVSRNSTMAGTAEMLASCYTYFKKTDMVNTEIEKYLNVTKDDIKRVANKYMNPENSVVLYYLPKK